MKVAAPFLLLPLFLLGSGAFGEGTDGRENLPSSASRIPGVQTLLSTSQGVYSLGGPALRFLPKGKARWMVTHRVAGDDLYRLASDGKGRILAAWALENRVHLFGPNPKDHRIFPKPPQSSGDFRSREVDSLAFTPDGRGFVVYVSGVVGKQEHATAAYRYDLSGSSGPKELFRTTFLRLYASGQAALFVIPQNPNKPCDFRDCAPIAAIQAYEFTGSKAQAWDIFKAPPYTFSTARGIAGGGDEGLALVLEDSHNQRTLLRWRAGQGAAETQLIPPQSMESARSYLAKNGDLIEAWKTEEQGLILKRLSPKGSLTSLSLPAPPLGDLDVELDTRVYAMKERKNGEIFLHWGDYLVFLGKGEPRLLNLVSLLGRLDEWANADIYVEEPEALWLGVDLETNRDFVKVDMRDAERRAKPIP